MKELKIQITKAQITGFHVDLNDKGLPTVAVQIALLTEHGKKITNYQISTQHWDDDSKFDMPISLINPIMEIMKDLETESIRHIQRGQKSLSEREEILI